MTRIMLGGALAGVLGAFLITGQAHADRVHLVDGAVIAGKATRVGNKVVIELEGGQVELSAREVARIESAPSALRRYEELEAVERPRGVPGLLTLANYCRDSGMPQRERELLTSVLEHEPDHAEARARLGYVKTPRGWLTREEQLLAQGFVRDGSEYVTREHQLERERLRAQTAAAEHAREQAKLELERQKLVLEQEKLALERERERAAAEAEAQARRDEAATPAWIFTGGFNTGGFNTRHQHEHGRSCDRRTCREAPVRRTKPFPIPGVRDPRDTSWSIPGTKHPRTY